MRNDLRNFHIQRSSKNVNISSEEADVYVKCVLCVLHMYIIILWSALLH